MEIQKVGVVGCGLMGHGITQICAQAGWDVVVRELDQDALGKGMSKIEKQLGRAVEKGKLEQADADSIRGRITPTLDYSDLAECDLVIEAITEPTSRPTPRRCRSPSRRRRRRVPGGSSGCTSSTRLR